MSFLDEIVKSGGLGEMADLVAKNPQILGAAASLLSTKQGSVGGTGGLAAVLSALHGKGLGDVASSWVGTGPNKAVTADQLAGALGDDALGQFAKHAGIGANSAGAVLASVLPALINQLSPEGKVASTASLEGVLGGLLSGLRG
jgi:uncharacterized protein YidB (DUF937 family)